MPEHSKRKKKKRSPSRDKERERDKKPKEERSSDNTSGENSARKKASKGVHKKKKKPQIKVKGGKGATKDTQNEESESSRGEERPEKGNHHHGKQKEPSAEVEKKPNHHKKKKRKDRQEPSDGNPEALKTKNSKHHEKTRHHKVSRSHNIVHHDKPHPPPSGQESSNNDPAPPQPPPKPRTPQSESESVKRRHRKKGAKPSREREHDKKQQESERDRNRPSQEREERPDNDRKPHKEKHHRAPKPVPPDAPPFPAHPQMMAAGLPGQGFNPSKEDLPNDLPEKEKLNTEAEVPLATGSMFIQEGKMMVLKSSKIQFAESADADFGTIKVLYVPEKGEKSCRAMAYELHQTSFCRLKVIATILACTTARAKKDSHFLRMLQLGITENDPKFRFLVTDEYGSNLSELLISQGHAFSPNTALRVALETMEAIQELHVIGYVSRDIKPAAFAIGSGKNKNRIYLVHTGLGRKYLEEDGSLKKDRQKCACFGNLKYASRRAHEHRDRGRYDDLESWYYMVCEFFGSRTALPWRSLHRNKDICDNKVAFMCMDGFTHFRKRLPSMPASFAIMMNFLPRGQFADDPKYANMKHPIEVELGRNGGPGVPYDWDNFTVSKAVDPNNLPPFEPPPLPGQTPPAPHKETNCEPDKKDSNKEAAGKDSNKEVKDSNKERKAKDSQKERPGKDSNKEQPGKDSNKEQPGKDSNKEKPPPKEAPEGPPSCSKKDDFISAKENI